MKRPAQGNGSTKFEIHDDDMGGWVRVFSSCTDRPVEFPVYLSLSRSEWFRQRPNLRL